MSERKAITEYDEMCENMWAESRGGDSAKTHVYKTGGFKRLTTIARETGTDIAHERLAFDGVDQILIREPGYVYIWLSNENDTPVEVYFDDFKVTHTKSPVIATDDYYPFGLSFNSYQRENSLTNQYKYNGKELQDELNLGWYDYGARMYMPEIGRWGVVDLLSERTARWSPYTYGYNNPMRFTDPTGMANEDEVDRKGYEKDGKQHLDITYGSDDEGGGGGGAAGVGIGGCCGGKFEIKQDATGGSNGSAKLAQVQHAMNQKADRLAMIAQIKRWLNFAKVVDYSDLYYKLTNTNFQFQNFGLGKGLGGGGKIKDGADLIIAIGEGNDWGNIIKELASLGISFTKIADGYAVIEVGVDLLQLIGEGSMPEYAIQLKQIANANFSEAMKFEQGSPLHEKYFKRATKYENDAYDVVDQIFKLK